MNDKVLDMISLVTKFWIHSGEFITRMTYPKPTKILGPTNILKKAIIDFPLIGILILILAAKYQATEPFQNILNSILFFGGLSVVTFLQWLVGEFVWCYLIWNPRARKFKK